MKKSLDSFEVYRQCDVQKRLKILIIKAFSKLTSSSTLALGLKKLGHQVEIAVPFFSADTELAMKSGITVHKVNIRSSLFTQNFIRKRYVDIGSIFQLTDLYREGNYDIINLNLLRARVLGRLAHIRVKKGIIVSTIQGEDLNNPWYYLMERATNWLDGSTVAISKATKEYLVERGIHKNKIEVIYNGIDLNTYDEILPKKQYLHRELNLSGHIKLVGMIAYFYPKVKGHETFLEAARIVLQEIGNRKIKFVLVGNDPYGGNYSYEVKEYARKLGIQDSVFFLGERRDIPNIISSCEMLVLPSNAREGFGLVLIEAMGRRVPVVGSNTGAIPEIIKDGETGLLVPPKNPQGLADTMMLLLSNPEKAREMGQVGRKRVEENFIAEIMTRKYEKLFYRLINDENFE